MAHPVRWLGLWWRRHFSNVTQRERRGYLVWFTVAVAIGFPEISAAIQGDGSPWPTISSTVGNLELDTGVTSLIVVVLIVFFPVTLSATRRRPSEP